MDSVYPVVITVLFGFSKQKYDHQTNIVLKKQNKQKYVNLSPLIIEKEIAPPLPLVPIKE